MEQSIKISALTAAARHMLPLIILLTGLAVVAMLAYGRLSPPKFEVSMLIAPPSDSFSLNAPAGLGAAGGLSGLLSGGSASSVNDFDKFPEVISSPALAQRMIDRHPDVMRKVFANQWDAQSGSWREPGGLGAFAKKLIRSLFGREGWMAPNANDLSRYINASVLITNIGRSGMKSMTFAHTDAKFALTFLKFLHQEADGLLREDAYSSTTTKIDYLLKQLQTASVKELRDALTQLLINEERKYMLLRNSLPFSAAIVVPPVLPSTPVGMSPPMMLAMGILLGLMVSSLVCVWLYLAFPAVRRRNFWTLAPARRGVSPSHPPEL
jgi:hypothetical protein